MRFMMIVKANKDSEAGVMPEEKMIAAMTRYNEELAKAGVLLGLDGLHPSAKGARVSFPGGKPRVTDGPFSESKEIVGGYAIMEARSRDEALALARRFMELHLKHWPTFEGECEMRPYQEGPPPTL